MHLPSQPGPGYLTSCHCLFCGELMREVFVHFDDIDGVADNHCLRWYHTLQGDNSLFKVVPYISGKI